ncbi:MAG: metallophosphoesterase [Pirellulales bacterium]
MIYLLLILAVLGHVVFWASIVNRLHGLGIKRHWIDLATIACGTAMGGIPLVIAHYFWQRGALTFTGGGAVGSVAAVYVYLSAVACLCAAAHRLILTLHPERSGALASNHTSRVDLSHHRLDALAAPGIPRWMARVPGNQIFDLHLHEKQIVIPRMPSGGLLRIAHITDLHMSGRVAKEYFVEIVDTINRLEPDLVTLTGDLVEREECLGWLPDTLGRLRAKAGVYYVLGNHDLRINHRGLLAELNGLGLIHVGGTWREAEIGDLRVVLAGNEMPWLGPAPNPALLPPRDENELPLRILLAHTPDQFRWAATHDFDLMLAGHNHGGQIRLPWLGAILAPSLSGVRYASGTFRRASTVMHVGRGTGGLTPFRWNCPPEIALLELMS